MKRKRFIFSGALKLKSTFTIAPILCILLLSPGHEAKGANSVLINGQPAVMIALGDSIGEGVQSADASIASQIFSYPNLIASHVGFPFSLPLINTSALGVVGSASNRTRLDTSLYALNLAVSGANVHSLLYERANAVSPDLIDSETDLVLFPWLGSQMEIVEYVNHLVPLFITCWIGNNDVLSAAISFDRLDASQLTPVENFRVDFSEITRRLNALGRPVVFANIPNVTNIGFLLDRNDLIKFLGSDYGLREGDYTSIVVMFLIRLGLDDGSLIRNPNFVLDSSEVALIQERITTFNLIIQEETARYNFPVVDINAMFDSIITDPPSFFGIPLSNRYLGGMFSLDGVHPSNIGHALVTAAFIDKISSHYNMNIPPISQSTMEAIFLTDPFVDKDSDGKVTGRFGTGFLETIGPFLSISGDADDFNPDVAVMNDSMRNTAPSTQRPVPSDAVLSLEVSRLSKDDFVGLFRNIFDLKK